jgi:hypothetical protein
MLFLYVKVMLKLLLKVVIIKYNSIFVLSLLKKWKIKQIINNVNIVVN